MEKAYDKLNWDFLTSALNFFNFPPKWVNLLRSCVSPVKHNIIINGGLSEQITPTCGIRQGDPISPYLFILCMEVFTQIINKEVDNKNWKPFKIGQCRLSHLFFADDVILFSKVEVNSLEAMNRDLLSFLSCSRLLVNRSKSTLWFSKNTPRNLQVVAENILRFNSSPSLGKYLGFPIGIKNSTSDFKIVVDKIVGKIESWKSKSLSWAGKVTLIKSICTPIAAYYMHCLSFPKSICNMIDKALRNFL